MTDSPVALADAVDVLRDGDPVGYVDGLLDRVDAVEPDVRAFVEPPDRERLLREARALSDRFPDEKPALYGVPVGVKDVFRADGLPTRAGTDLPMGAFEGREATAVTRLREAGAVVMGKTVTAEFAYFEPGPTRNPHDLDHTPGGSSSGSAAAVAAGTCPLALGTQTVGSVIRPAAFCGVVGFKPSYGRIPTDGVVPFSPSADHVGLFTRDVPGAAIAASVLCDDWNDVRPDARPVLGVPDEAYLHQASTVGRDLFEAGLEELAAAGYEIRRTTVLSDVGSVNDRHETMIAAEMALAHDGWFATYGDRYADVTANLIEEGRAVDVGSLVDARNGRSELRDALHGHMDDRGIDVWISPAAPGPAPAGIDDTGDPVMNLPWTHAGLPAVSIPAGTVDGLPVGMQCAARFGADEALLHWGGDVADVLGGVA